jgi:preprotein translocase subunit SecE
VKDYIVLILWVIVIGGAFAYAWYKGYLMRLARYIEETREELKKCTWPTRDELSGSTVVIMVTIVLLGGYTVGIDFIFTLLIRLLT